MNAEEANKTINQMIGFIQKEAEERAEEIKRKTEEECTVEKGNIISEARKKMVEEYEIKKANMAVQRKIEKSTAASKNKLKTMSERNEMMETLKAETKKQLTGMLRDNPESYKKLMRELILQGLLKLMEVDVSVRCRKSDVELVKEILEPVKAEYVKKLQTEVPKLKGKDIKCSIKVDEKAFLPELQTKESGLPSCAGGVELRAHREKIVCQNTIDARLELCFQAGLPVIRGLLFPPLEKEKEPVAVGAEKKEGSGVMEEKKGD